MSIQMYTTEFIQAIEKIENDVNEAINEWAYNLGRDPMIECRNLSVGDSNEFKDGFFVRSETYEIDVSQEINFINRKTVEEISDTVCRKTKVYLQKLVESKIEESETPIRLIRDVRKFIKVVVDDAIINLPNLGLEVRIGIEEYIQI